MLKLFGRRKSNCRTVLSDKLYLFKLPTVNTYRAYSIDGRYKQSGVSRPILWILGLSTLGTGGVVVYVRSSPSYQKWLKENIPGGESLVNIVCQELKFEPFYSFTNSFRSAKETVSDIYNSVGFGKKDESSTSSNEVLKPLARHVPKSPPEKNESKPVPASEQKANSSSATQHNVKKEESEPENVQKSEDKNSKKLKEEINDKYINEIIKKIDSAEKVVIGAASEMAKTLKDYREQVVYLIEQAVDKDDDQMLYKIRTKLEEKEENMMRVEKYARKATTNLNKLRKLVYDENVDIPEAKREELKEIIATKERNITDALSTTNLEKSSMLLAEEYYHKLLEARNHLSNSLGMIFPELNIESVEDVSSEELELFIMYAYRLIKYYQKEVEKLEAFKTAQLNKILDAIKEGDSKTIEEAVNIHLENEKRKLTEQFIKSEFNLKTEHEKALRLHLKRQAEVHNDHVNDVIDLKNKEHDRLLKHYHDNEIDALRINYNKQLARMVAYLKHLEGVISERADAEKRAQRSQLLWNACQSLMLSLKDGVSTKPWNEQLKPLEQEVHSIAKAAVEGDEFVNVVVSSIPQKARYRGVYCEFALRDRFLNVEKLAFRLAAVPDGHASLVSMFLSYLQSIFIVKLPSPIPTSELNNEPIDPSDLNNYDILHRARYWIDRGDFLQTLRYMNLLTGASRAIANEWMNETRMFLETKQAANTLLLYSIYSSLIYTNKG